MYVHACAKLFRIATIIGIMAHLWTAAPTSVQKSSRVGEGVCEEDTKLELASVHHHVALERIERMMHDMRQTRCRHADGEIKN